MMKFNKQQILADLRTLRNYSREYFLHPLEHIKNPPLLQLESVLVIIFAINIVYGLLRALYHFNIINFFISLLLTPILASILLGLTTLFLFYFFQIIFQKTFTFHKISTVILVSYLPGSLFFLASVAYPPLFLMGILVMSALVTVGIVENFQVPRKTVLYLVSAGAFLAVVFWVFDQIYVYRTPIEPKSVEQLEDELSK